MWNEEMIELKKFKFKITAIKLMLELLQVKP